ncbi:MAG: hypothetical protein AMK73_04095 [Planctomycetes bacterium SM23_32]|nr:MAG: hypothetical protein AMK73_04095 [Planctomycetes bacterium SM23_32]
MARCGARAAVRAFVNAAPRTVKNGLRPRFRGLARRAGGLLVLSGVDFGRTRAYPAGQMGGLFVNLRGRQPHGVVEPGAEHEAARNELIACLSELRDPETQRPVARAVHRREGVWAGPLLECLPDAIMEHEEEVYEITFGAGAGAPVFHDLAPPGAIGWRRSGGHRRDGLLLAMGPHIRQAKVRDAAIADVPPTVLALLGCPIPEDFDGRVLAEILTDGVPLPGRTAGAPGAKGEGQRLS